tara:strand:- start:254 stop:553 length:300 start_codon:yes stop_codon:yes gene_type:complete
MKKLIENLIEELVRGTSRKLTSINFSIDKRNQDLLRETLQKELMKPSIKQSKTPTQLVNEFLYKKFNQNFDLTPSSFGDKAHELIMEWGIQKTEDFHEH